MRARTGRVAVVILASISICGCTSSPSWNGLSWWHKKDSTAVAEAPKFNPANPALPSAGQNPSNSMANLSHPSAAMAAAANPGAPSGTTGYGAAPAAYQNSAYPTTPYQQAKLPAAAAPAAGSAAWNGGSQIPGPAVAYGAPAGPPAGSAMAQNNASGAQTTTIAAAPGYGSATAMAAAPGYTGPAAPAAPASQPQSGFYNPTYDGGAAATRYASGAPIPATQSVTSLSAGASTQLPMTYPSNSMPNISAGGYRTADARSSMAAGAATVAGADAAAGGGNLSSSTVGDRYAGFNTAAGAGAPVAVAAASTVPASVPPAGDRYATPPSASGSTMPSGMSGVGDRYSQPAAAPSDQSTGGIQPGTPPVGATGYNPVDPAYSTSTASSPMSNLPARGNPEYRPGGTSNYISPTGNPVQPASTGAQPDAHSGGVAPASCAPTATSGRTPSGVVLASAATPVPSGGDTYGAYQGSAYLGTTAAGNSEPAYGAPNPVAATPALLPAQSAR